MRRARKSWIYPGIVNRESVELTRENPAVAEILGPGLREFAQVGKCKREPADKPGSVKDDHPSGTAVASGLERPTRKRGGRRRQPLPAGCFPIRSCSRWGFPCRGVLPPARCALTAPFHPYRRRLGPRRYIFCGTFRGLAPPRRYLAPCPLEPGLSSRALPRERSPGRLLRGH